MTFSGLILAYCIVGVLHTANDVRKPAVALFYSGFSKTTFFTAFILGVLTWLPGEALVCYRKINKSNKK